MSHIPQDAARRLVDKLGAAAPHLEWRMVPVEATAEMVADGWNEGLRNLAGANATRACWAAMLAAAPHPPIAQPQAAPTDEEIASWADSFILAQAFNRPIAVQIALEAAKWVRSRLAQPQAAGWRPISEAPRDGTRILVTNGFGVWFAEWRPVAPSGFRFADPWFSTMLNHNHISEKHRHKAPTHWQPLPEPPKEGA